MDWTYNTIWTEQLPPGAYASIDCHGGTLAPGGAASATYVNLHKFKTKQPGFDELNGLISAEYLEVNQSNIKSFCGLEKLGAIKRLELSWCLKLESDFGLAELKDSLEWLHINTSRKFSPGPDLYALRDLKVLCMNGCGAIEDLGFLARMPNLLDFRFVGTTVLDGDLTPLLEHPCLVNAGFLDKRHYNLKSDDVAAHFQDANERAKEYVYKGDFRTFRYKSLKGT
jgi:hypothetical protein